MYRCLAPTPGWPPLHGVFDPQPDVKITRPLSRRLLALALASALASAPVFSVTAQTVTPFTVSDIRIDGLQRISAGSVFTYLPVERGDTLDQAAAGDAVRALYKTGFFEDVRLDP